jgi:tetratricopeptide (TPR) repeat protein
MGYSLEQARVALAATDTGDDVQAAVEILISGSTDSSSAPAPRSRRARPEEADDGWGESVPRPRFNYDDEDEEESRPPRQRPDASPAPTPASRRPAAPRTSSTTSSQREGANDYQLQADKLLAQASEIGLNVFNKANSLWKQGREQAKKVYEDQVAASGSRASSTAPRSNGQPRWMQAALAKDEEEQRAGDGRQDTQPFVDDGLSSPASRTQASKTRKKPQAMPQATAPSTGDLFSDDGPRTYKSPFRHGSDRPAASTQVSTTPPRKAPSPAGLVQRQTIPASAPVIASSNAHKASGTEMFKLGRYAEAEAAYTAAAAQLPDGHLLRIPVLNNRAAARLKTGDTTGAVDDCSAVIALVGPGYHPAREARIAQVDHGAGVSLGDALVKAWRRRAEAHEAREKWDLARQDWEAIAGADFAGAIRRDAAVGATRCRQAVAAAKRAEAPPVPVAKPKPKPKPTRPAPRRGPTPPSEALSRLKQANAEADAEDQAKYELKDVVDARLAAWKAGKETNIRALISSLDTVLWPELGWQKVSMAELLTPNQVKIRYTKAIAKLHPDKVRAFARYFIYGLSPDDRVAECAQYDGRAAHDRKWSLWQPQRRMERVPIL